MIITDRLVDVDGEDVTINLDDHLIDTCITSSRLSKCEAKGHITSHIYPLGISKCFAFHYTYPQRIWEAAIWLKSSIFPNGIRPPFWRFVVQIVYPNQVLRVSEEMGQWPARNNASGPYAMYFRIQGVEVLKRRNKYGSECYDWKNYDSIAMEDVLSDVGCRPFKLKSFNAYPPCDTKEKMARIHEQLVRMLSNEPNLAPPCIEIQKLQITQKEEEANAIREQEYVGLNASLENVDGWFRVSIVFPDNTFKEIRQSRAISPQALIGNTGGYVGLFLGYTVVELSVLLVKGYQFIIALILGLKNLAVRNIKNHEKDKLTVRRKHWKEEEWRKKYQRSNTFLSDVVEDIA